MLIFAYIYLLLISLFLVSQKKTHVCTESTTVAYCMLGAYKRVIIDAWQLLSVFTEPPCRIY